MSREIEKRVHKATQRQEEVRERGRKGGGRGKKAHTSLLLLCCSAVFCCLATAFDNKISKNTSKLVIEITGLVTRDGHIRGPGLFVSPFKKTGHVDPIYLYKILHILRLVVTTFYCNDHSK